MKKYITALGIALVSFTGVFAEETGGQEVAERVVEMSAQERLLEQLFSAEFLDDAGYQALLTEASEKGMSAQNILETEVYFQLISGTHEDLKGLLERLEAMESAWSFDEKAVLIQEASDLEALKHVIEAKVAYNGQDIKQFEEHIKSAYWLEPELSFITTPWVEEIEKVKREQAEVAEKEKIAKATKAAKKGTLVPLDVELPLTSGGTTTLADLVKGKKAVLLDFWATFCGPCMSMMPELKERASVLQPQGVAVVGVNTDNLKKAEKVRLSKGIEFPWVKEPESMIYSRMFRIDSIPRAILVSADGEVLFNGHPQDAALQRKLVSLGIK